MSFGLQTPAGAPLAARNEISRGLQGQCVPATTWPHDLADLLSLVGGTQLVQHASEEVIHPAQPLRQSIGSLAGGGPSPRLQVGEQYYFLSPLVYTTLPTWLSTAATPIGRATLRLPVLHLLSLLSCFSPPSCRPDIRQLLHQSARLGSQDGVRSREERLRSG